jgi:hypothetical protein
MSWRSALTHPAMAMVLTIVLCRLGMPRWQKGGFRMDKEFYPLNSFPMYADPGPEASEYVVTTDGNNEPVSWKELTGDTSAKVKKKFVATRNRLADEAGIKKADEAPPEILQRAWEQVVDGLRHTAARRKKTLPATLRLSLYKIYQDEGQFREEFNVVGEVK